MSTNGFTSYAPGGSPPDVLHTIPSGAPSPALTRVIEAMRRNLPAEVAGWEEQRRELLRATSGFTLPAGTAVIDVSLGNVGAEVIGTPAQIARPRRLVHFHGGGYTIGSPVTARPVVCALANATDTAVVSVDYRLAPEHAFPAALDDAIEVYSVLLGDFEPGSIALTGDSAGGGLALATAVRLRDSGMDAPAAVVALSPWLDLTLSSGPGDEAQASDPQIGPDQLASMADAYLRGADPRAPTASPLFASLDGLPPILVQVGTHEYLREDALLLIAAAHRQSADITVDVFDGMIHVWHALAPRLETANVALARVASWLSAHAPAFRCSEESR